MIYNKNEIICKINLDIKTKTFYICPIQNEIKMENQTNWQLIKGETVIFTGTYKDVKSYESDMRKNMHERGTGLNMFEYIKAGYKIVNNNF